MQRKPRPRGASIMSARVIITAGAVGLFIAVCLDALIAFGQHHYGSTAVGSSIG